MYDLCKYMCFLIFTVHSVHVCVSHFRNGCQKTGAYCCAAYVIEKLKEEQEVDVFTSVRQIRLSRPQFIVNLVSARVWSCERTCIWSCECAGVSLVFGAQHAYVRFFLRNSFRVCTRMLVGTMPFSSSCVLGAIQISTQRCRCIPGTI